MRSLLARLASLLILAFGIVHARAAVDIETSALPDRVREIVVVEVENCIYCGLFRRDVLPTYRGSIRAKSVPIRFVDLNDPEFERLRLETPIDSVPTVVILEDGRELGRIPGYVGPENFFHSLSRLLPDTD